MKIQVKYVAEVEIDDEYASELIERQDKREDLVTATKHSLDQPIYGNMDDDNFSDVFITIFDDKFEEVGFCCS